MSNVSRAALAGALTGALGAAALGVPPALLAADRRFESIHTVAHPDAAISEISDARDVEFVGSDGLSAPLHDGAAARDTERGRT